MRDVLVVIPTFDCSPLFIKALKSVYLQTCYPKEIFIIGDCCSLREKLHHIIRNFSLALPETKVSVHNLEAPERGTGAALRNFAIKNSSSEFITYLDDDSVWESTYLKVMLDILDKKGADLVWCGSYEIKESKPITWAPKDLAFLKSPDESQCKEGKVLKSKGDVAVAKFPPDAPHKEFVSTSGILHRRSILQLLEGHFDKMWWCDDISETGFDLVSRLREKGANCIPVKRLLTHRFIDNAKALETPLSPNDNFEKVFAKISQIKGWLTREEAAILYELSRRKECSFIVEIGAYHGRSTTLLASSGNEVVTFDPMKEIFSAPIEDSVRIALAANLSYYSNAKWYRHGVSADVLSKKRVDLLYIDGNHIYPAPLEDFNVVFPFLHKESYVCFHDYGSHRPGVCRAVDELVAKKRFKITKKAGILVAGVPLL